MSFLTVFHLLRTDIRRLRALILWTLLLLAADFIIAMLAGEGRVPAYYSNSEVDFRSGGWLIPLRVGGITGAFLAGAAGWLGLSWSRTRPVRRREAFAAKTGFLLLFLILPQMLMVFTVLLRHGIPLREAMLGTAAAAGVFVPLWVMFSALGRLAGSGPAFLTGLVFIALSGGLLSLFEPRMLASLFMPLSDPWGQWAGPYSWFFLGTCAAGLLLLIPFSRRHWKTWSRLTAAAVVVVSAAWFWRFTYWFQIGSDLLSNHGVPAAVIDSVRAVSPLNGFNAQESAANGRRAIALTGAFRAEGLADGVFAFWQPSGKARITAGGRVLAEAQSREVVKGRPQLMNFLPPKGSRADNAALAAALPSTAGAVTRPKDHAFMLQFGSAWEKAPENLGKFVPVEQGTEFAGRLVSLEADMTAVLFRYEVIIDTPLETPLSTARGATQVHVRRSANTMRDPMGAPQYSLGPRIEILVQSPALGYSGDLLCATWMVSPDRAWRVLLHNPATGTVEEGHQLFSSRSPLLGGGGIFRLVYGFTRDGAEIGSAVPGSRLMILEQKILGSSTQRVITPPALLNFSNAGEGDYELLTSGDPPPPHPALDPATATREEFGQWLRAELGYRWKHRTEDTLAPWIPRFSGVLFNLRPTGTDHEDEVCKALASYLPDSRRDELIRELPESPRLSWVIYRRGWEQAARRELLELFTSGRPLNLMTLKCVASLKEPATYERLLNHLETGGNEELYETLRHLPGIEPRLTESVKRYFARITLNGKPPGEKWSYNSGTPYARRLEVPLRHGLPEALSDALAVFRWETARLAGVEGTTEDYHSESLMHYLSVPLHLKPRTKAAREYLSALKPEDCRYDPLTCRWLTPGVLP